MDKPPPIVMPCPSMTDLLLASEGELPAPELHDIAVHLRVCEPCGENWQRFIEVEGKIKAFLATDDESAVQASLARIKRGLNGHAYAPQMPHVPPHVQRHYAHGRNSGGSASRWPVRRLMPVAAMIPVVIAGLFLYMFLSTQSVAIQAEELLTRAAALETSRLSGREQQVRVRVMPSGAAARVTPGIGGRPGLGAGTDSPPVESAGGPLLPSFLATFQLFDGVGSGVGTASDGTTVAPSPALAQLLDALHIDLRRPLLIAPIRQWRASLTRKTEVIATTDDTVTLRVTTPAHPLRHVEVVIRRDSYHVLRQVLVFNGVGRLEIDEIAQWVRQATEPIAVTPAVPGAMLGKSIPPPSLKGLGGIAVAPGTATSTLGRPGLPRWLDRNFSNAATKHTYVPNVERHVSTVSRRLETLASLAARHSQAESQRLSPAVRETLRRERDQHYRALIAELATLEDALGIIVGTLNRALAPRRTPENWQPRVTAALAHAKTLDQQIQQLFSDPNLASSTTSSPAQRAIGKTLDALWDAVHDANWPASRP